jgi:hypothetical protein
LSFGISSWSPTWIFLCWVSGPGFMDWDEQWRKRYGLGFYKFLIVFPIFLYWQSWLWPYLNNRKKWRGEFKLQHMIRCIYSLHGYNANVKNTISYGSKDAWCKKLSTFELVVPLLVTHHHSLEVIHFLRALPNKFGCLVRYYTDNKDCHSFNSLKCSKKKSMDASLGVLAL